MEIVNIPMNRIAISSLNTRSDLNAGTEDASLENLADSIRERGLLNPVTVKPLDGERFDIIAGQRRFLACGMIGLTEIPAIIRENLDDTDAVILSLIENVQRAEMNPMDKARAFQRIHESVGSYQEVAKQARVSASTVRRYATLLELAPSIQERVSTSDGVAGVGALSELARWFTPEDQEEALEEIGGFKQDLQRRILRDSTDKRLVETSIAGPKGASGPKGAPGAGGYVPGALDTAQRQVISQASVSMEVDEVPVAVAQVRTTAESLGGFVGQLSSSGGPERQQSTMTIRVPQAEFFTALEHIKSLGKVRSENVGSEDVTERFIDLEARLRSALREEESLLSLLDKANQVSEILTIERELSRVRSDIERAQGQLNFLERRVDLSTITVSLFPPDAEVAEPPSGSLTIEVSDVSRSVEGIKALVSGVGGELDRVFVAVRDGKESSDVTLRVFSKDFKQVLSSVEAHGKVRYKEIRETTVPVEAEATPPAKPDARIDISFVEKASSVVWRIIAIAAPVGGVALVALLGLLFYAAYRAGRHRGSLT